MNGGHPQYQRFVGARESLWMRHSAENILFFVFFAGDRSCASNRNELGCATMGPTPLRRRARGPTSTRRLGPPRRIANAIERKMRRAPRPTAGRRDRPTRSGSPQQRGGDDTHPVLSYTYGGSNARARSARYAPLNCKRPRGGPPTMCRLTRFGGCVLRNVGPTSTRGSQSKSAWRECCSPHHPARGRRRSRPHQAKDTCSDARFALVSESGLGEGACVEGCLTLNSSAPSRSFSSIPPDCPSRGPR